MGAGHHSHAITAGKYMKFGIPESKYLMLSRWSRTPASICGSASAYRIGMAQDDVPLFLQTVDELLMCVQDTKYGRA